MKVWRVESGEWSFGYSLRSSNKMVSNENTAKYKSKKFAIKIINCYKLLIYNKNEYILSKQLLRSGTSIGANLAESECAISENDFLNKVYIALKECNETLYWLELLNDTEYLDSIQFNDLYNDCNEIKRMLSASTKTLKEKLGLD